MSYIEEWMDGFSCYYGLKIKYMSILSFHVVVLAFLAPAGVNCLIYGAHVMED